MGKILDYGDYCDAILEKAWDYAFDDRDYRILKGYEDLDSLEDFIGVWCLNDEPLDLQNVRDNAKNLPNAIVDSGDYDWCEACLNFVNEYGKCHCE